MAQQRRQTLLEDRRPATARRRKPATDGSRKSVIHPQSDLQPVYDILDVLHPDNLKAVFNRLDFRTRWLIIITSATLILLWVTISLASGLAQHIRATSGPFLLDALQAPYSMTERTVPAADVTQITMLPMEIEDYILNLLTVETFIPGVTPVVEAAAEIADGSAAEVAPAEQYLLAECLLSAADFDPLAETNTGCLPFPVAYLTSGLYEGGASPIHLVAAQFDPVEVLTGNVMKSLKSQAERIGRMGNYVIGVGTVDFFYSSTPDLYSITWAHDGWVYTISTPDMNQLEKMLEAFPY